jgi:hypothetical protein
MTISESEKSQIRYARVAGFMYLFVDAAYILGMWITNRFQVPNNFAATAQKVADSEMLYRIGLCSSLVGALCTVFLAMGLYGTVKPINKNLALLALLFRLVEAALFAIQMIFGFVFLKLYTGGDLKSAFSVAQLSALQDLFSPVYAAGFNIAGIFFCIGSILFFYLFLQSNYIPKYLSAFGFMASLLVAVSTFAMLILPQPSRLVQLGWLPIAVAEIVVGIWLLCKGVNFQPRESVTSDSTAS